MPKPWERRLPEEYPDLAIRVLTVPSNLVRLKLVEAYRNGLAKGAGHGWRPRHEESALALARRRPVSLTKMLLFALGRFDSNVYERLRVERPPDPGEGAPTLLALNVHARAYAAADHFGISVDGLVSRIASGWLIAACEMDGEPIDPVKLAETENNGGRTTRTLSASRILRPRLADYNSTAWCSPMQMPAQVIELLKIQIHNSQFAPKSPRRYLNRKA